MNVDGASIVSGVSASSSQSSKRFRLFGLGKKRRARKKGEAAVDVPGTNASFDEKKSDHVSYDYGYEDDGGVINEQAPRDRQYDDKHFEPLIEGDDTSADPSLHQNEVKSGDDASSLGISNHSTLSSIRRQNSSVKSDSDSSASSSQEESDSDESSETDSDIEEVKPTKSAPHSNKSRQAPVSKPHIHQQQQLPPTMTASRAIEPQLNLTIIIPRHRRAKPPTPYSILTRARFFQSMIDNAFEEVDTDHSGLVDETQLYNALLQIHLKLGVYAGPAACRPLPRSRCQAIFDKFDIDENGFLDREEFGKVVVLMFSNVLFRVAVQWSMTILIVPVVAREILDGAGLVYACIMNALAVWSEQYWIIGMVYRFLAWLLWRCFLMLPAGVFMLLDACNDVKLAIPRRIWNNMPLTLLSTMLGVSLVPLLVFKIDSLTQFLADRRYAHKVKKQMGYGG
ncbi:hypothetical protein MPSEU_000659200 [Mayamaea pseudoterrestris]|nr:hypothetical protein MPSEU_000659200 [Mayamaea pseudoterrestris]